MIFFFLPIGIDQRSRGHTRIRGVNGAQLAQNQPTARLCVARRVTAPNLQKAGLVQLDTVRGCAVRVEHLQLIGWTLSAKTGYGICTIYNISLIFRPLNTLLANYDRLRLFLSL